MIGTSVKYVGPVNPVLCWRSGVAPILTVIVVGVLASILILLS